MVTQTCFDPGSGEKRMALRGCEHASAILNRIKKARRSTELVVSMPSKHLEEKKSSWVKIITYMHIIKINSDRKGL